MKMLDFFIYDIINIVHWKIIVLYGINLEKVGEFNKNKNGGFGRSAALLHLHLHPPLRLYLRIKKVNGRSPERDTHDSCSLYKLRTRRLTRAAAVNTTNEQCGN